MTSRWHYANEKLGRSIRLLTVLPGDVRSRLLQAFMEFHTLKEEDFPPELQKHFRWVMKELTRRGPLQDYKGEIYRGSVENTLNHIRNSTGAKIAERLLMLHDEVEEAIVVENTKFWLALSPAGGHEVPTLWFQVLTLLPLCAAE